MRVLLPTDYSENAWHAIQYAIYLFEDIETTFFVMHAHQAAPSSLVSTINKERDTRLHQITQDEVSIKLHKTVARLKKLNKVKFHQYEAILESEALVQAVGRNVIDKDVDFIVMGTQGASGLKEVFLGSNTVKIIKAIDFCPIIAVPHTYAFGPPKTIAFATDYRHQYQKMELNPLLQIVKLWKSSLHIVHMRTEDYLDEDQKNLQELLFRLLDPVNYDHTELSYHPTLAYRINDWAEDNKVDILAMFNSSRAFFQRLLREPVLKKIAFKTTMPFLILQEAK